MIRISNRLTPVPSIRLLLRVIRAREATNQGDWGDPSRREFALYAIHVCYMSSILNVTRHKHIENTNVCNSLLKWYELIFYVTSGEKCSGREHEVAVIMAHLVNEAHNGCDYVIDCGKYQ